ncbi:hypothetical protein FS837_012376 [Tulasnella sp. UAMH 9824]|nr:hypothetical protein FS837_012376 [Tulasnella sp. UAMH 9824]
MDALQFFRLIAFQSAITRYCMVAGYVWVLYDWFITLDQEIDLVWRRSGAWKSKVLYAFTRYHGLALLTYDLVVMLGSDWSPPFCKAYFFILGGCGLALLFAVEGALQLRIYVMYHSSLKVLIVNGIFFVLEMACMTVMFLVDTIRFEPMRTPPGLKGCFATSAEVKYSKAMWWVWLSLMGIPALHASATIGGCRMLLNLRAAYFESLQPRDIDSTAVSMFATDASIGRFRSFWTSSRKEDKQRQATTTSDHDHDRDGDGDGPAAERRYSIGMESWTSLNDHDHDGRIVRRASQAPPPPLAFHAGSSPTSPRRHLSPRQVDFGLSDVDIELQDLSRRQRKLDSVQGSSTDRSRHAPPSQRAAAFQNEPASPLPPSWNWEAQLSTSSPPSPSTPGP